MGFGSPFLSPLGLRGPFSRGNFFDSASLFAGGDEGILFDRLNPGDGFIFQDSALTTPVTAAGQPVGGIVDRSGNGNDALQATAGFRPLLQQDSNGNWYLDFDGTDDFLSSANIDLSATDELSIFAAVRKDSDAAVGVVTNLNSINNGSFRMQAPHSVGVTSYRHNSKGTLLKSATSTAFPAGSNNVLTGLSSVSEGSVTLRVDGNQVDTDTGDQGTGNYSSSSVFIGARSTATEFLNGRVYGICVLGRTSAAAEIDNIETNLANLSGVIL